MTPRDIANSSRGMIASFKITGKNLPAWRQAGGAVLRKLGINPSTSFTLLVPMTSHRQSESAIEVFRI